MKSLPVFLDVHQKTCLLVGEGEVAERKRRLLLKAGALVRHLPTGFVEADLDGVMLVVAASSDDALNALVSSFAQARNVPVNVVDRPALCTFIFPAIVERGDITVAVSSGGVAPVLTRLLRARLETFLPGTLTDFVARVAALRVEIKQRIPDARLRLRFWDRLLQDQLIGAAGNLEEIFSETKLQQVIHGFSSTSTQGSLAVVGAGPGDPDLLTFKALRCLQACDVLVFDERVDARIVSLARRDALQICVQHAASVADLLVKHAQAENVVYLLAGDPGSYRDLSAVMMAVAAEEIPVQCVPAVAGG